MHMLNILDSMRPKTRSFRPQTLGEYLALQLARRLGDSDLVWKYRSLFDQHPLTDVAEAFSNAQSRRLAGGPLIQAFDEELSALTTNEDDDAT